MEFFPEILIVDDDESMRFFLAEVMKKEGYSFEMAVSVFALQGNATEIQRPKILCFRDCKKYSHYCARDGYFISHERTQKRRSKLCLSSI